MNCCIHQFCSQVVGVAQAINKKCGDDGAFTEQDEKVSKVHCLPSMFKETGKDHVQTTSVKLQYTVSIFLQLNVLPHIISHFSILPSFLLSSLLFYLCFHATVQSYTLSCSVPVQQDFSAYLAFSGIVLHNAQLYETSQLENRRNQVGVCS